ncbi:helicase-related protein [Alkalimonas delamerensis]|uniref:Helicase-related protein n=1 Tax=Alkalimonas delamerensis TaxID=265981 RepID=A0ABT9GKD6_9GAMM|nr:helicase-related protein [Alkalimonas delamerensis]MDP4527432.1 helicase-related protein [Alkalimonas delamerensis]
MKKSEIRDLVKEEIRKLLIGPYDGPNEKVSGRLSLRYLSGILYPIGATRGHLKVEQPDELDKLADTRDSDEFSADNDNPLSLANEMLPSSVALTFCVPKNADVVASISGGKYKDISNKNTKQIWQRHELSPTSVQIGAARNQKHFALNNSVVVRVTRREAVFDKSIDVVTVAIVNASSVEKSSSAESKDNIEKRVYQLGLVCNCSSGISAYQDTSKRFDDLEEEILALQYSKNSVFAIGHGASVSWNLEKSNRVKEVYIEYAPSALVFRPLFDSLKIESGEEFKYLEILSLGYLSNPDSIHKEVILRLNSFVDFYGNWITLQNDQKVKPDLSRAKQHLLSKMRMCHERMKKGVELLESNTDCWDAFQLANGAMLLQMEQNQRINKLRSKRNNEGKQWPIPVDDAINPGESFIPYHLPNCWRPFQLAFFLLTVSDLEHPNSDYAEIADLIWFSTGGGKTEAYLLLSAYELIRRRKRYSSPELGGGTGVITRYTLRFLTADQFARTGSLICALEKIRQSNQFDLGDEPFSLGLYAGNSVSHNKVSDAENEIFLLRENPTETHHFQIEYCPNCGTSMLPKHIKFKDGEPDYSEIGFSIEHHQVKTRCVNKLCLFSNNVGLPIRTVDEDIFRSPPSFLLGTIDKFANFAFGERESAIFKGANGSNVPPTLIIQDELHLISGPLGTIAAVYEAAFDTIIRVQNNKIGLGSSGPKYIASSATVRDSDTQIRRLLGRSGEIFPPRGISASDSFFSKDDNDEESARLYVGYMAQGLNATSAAHWTAAAILQAVRGLAEKHTLNAADVDFLWSLVCYCNSKRELGLINASTNDEILSRMRVYCAIQGLDEEIIPHLRKEEVSSQGVKSISETRSNLLIPLTDLRDTPVRDFIPATNMISVGVDINRLGVMMINGQPKTTAEYIQASSRVGRSPIENGPGFVVTLYSPAKPRDRSHYEHFRAYHETLYRLVEPTSVTPGSEQALDRALHAAIIIALRHSVGELKTYPRKADFGNSETQHVLLNLKERLLAAYPDLILNEFERRTINICFGNVLNKWSELAERFGDLVYFSWENKGHPLMTDFQQKSKSGFPTMTSMRSVDVSIPMKLR